MRDPPIRPFTSHALVVQAVILFILYFIYMYISAYYGPLAELNRAAAGLAP